MPRPKAALSDELVKRAKDSGRSIARQRVVDSELKALFYFLKVEDFSEIEKGSVDVEKIRELASFLVDELDLAAGSATNYYRTACLELRRNGFLDTSATDFEFRFEDVKRIGLRLIAQDTRELSKAKPLSRQQWITIPLQQRFWYLYYFSFMIVFDIE